MLDTARKALAILIAIRAATNFGKPFMTGAGFVVGGKLMHGGVATTVVAPVVGVLMLALAWGLWHARPWARPLAVAYAVWATLNVILFPLLEPMPPRVTPPLYGLFALGGIAGPWAAVWLLGRAAARPGAR